MAQKQKTIVIGAGPVGALAAIYAAQRGHEVEVYEFRGGRFFESCHISSACSVCFVYLLHGWGMGSRDTSVFMSSSGANCLLMLCH